MVIKDQMGIATEVNLDFKEQLRLHILIRRYM